MQHKRGQKKHPLNDPGKWDLDIAPLAFDRHAYQARIDERVGRNREGKSIVRLVWGPEVVGIWGVPRYFLDSVKNGEDFLYRTVKRWYMEIRLERGVYYDAWKSGQFSLLEPVGEASVCADCGSTKEPQDFFSDIGTGNFAQKRCVDCGAQWQMKTAPVDRGEPPEELFEFLWMCAEHEAKDQDAQFPRCCERANRDKNGQRCYGEYRDPNDADLELISAAIRRRDSQPWHDPYEPLTPRDLALIEAASGLQVERLNLAVEERKQEILRDQRVLSERGGTFHDLGGFEKTKSGLYLPN